MATKKDNLKILQGKLIIESFIKAPHPLTITRAEDGTYVEVNEAAAKYIGFSREKLIGRKSTEVGTMQKEKRQMIIEEIKTNGYAKNIELKSKPIKNKVQYLLFNVFPLKLEGKSFFLSIVTDISTSQHKKDVLFSLRLPDTERVKEKLKQYKLSPRQQEAALLASLGYSNIQIAQKMHITDYTAKDYIKKIFKVIRVRNRREISPKVLNWK